MYGPNITYYLDGAHTDNSIQVFVIFWYSSLDLQFLKSNL